MTDSLRQRVVDKMRSQGSTQALLGACGKHRSYREHFDDLARQPDLVSFKDELYSRGLKDAVDQGIWKSLKEAGDSLPFHHTIFGRRKSQWVIGRLLTSPDSIGRSEYPLVLFALIDGIAPEHIQAGALPLLRQLEAKVMAADSIQQVQTEISSARSQLTAWASGDFDTLTLTDPPLRRLSRFPTFKASRQGIINTLYQLNRRFNSERSDTRTMLNRGLHIRVPCTPETSSVEAVLWNQVVKSEVGSTEPSTVFDPEGTSWIDLVIGKPSPGDFYCLHANEKVLPRVDAIPYQIDPDVLEQINARIDRTSTTLTSPPTDAAAASPSLPADRKGWKKWLPW